jgi:hypothetical protein
MNTDVMEFIAAVVAIAKDPKTFEKSLGDAKEAAEKLTEARKLSRNAITEHDAAMKDLEAARYERGQADHANRTQAQQATANEARGKELDARAKELDNQRQSHEHAAARANAEIARREAELETRERAADEKLKQAQTLMEKYDEAKHQAALKLAS